MSVADKFSVHKTEDTGEDGEPVVRWWLHHLDRPIAEFADVETHESDSKKLLEALNRYWDLLDAVRDLVFLVGQLPAAKTITDQELNRAYVRASDFLREEHEQRIAGSQETQGTSDG